MQKTLMEHLRESELAQQWRAVETAATLEAMMAAAWVLARALVLGLMRQVLEARAADAEVSKHEVARLRDLRKATAEQGVGAPPFATSGVDRTGRDVEMEAAGRALPARVPGWADRTDGPGAGA